MAVALALTTAVAIQAVLLTLAAEIVAEAAEIKTWKLEVAPIAVEKDGKPVMVFVCVRCSKIPGVCACKPEEEDDPQIKNPA